MANYLGALRFNEYWKTAEELKVQHEEYKLRPLETKCLRSALPAGVPRGTILEVFGRRSSGRTSVCHHLLAQATARGEICAVVDLCNTFHPASAAAAGVQLERIVWVRCSNNLEGAIRVSDLLLHAGGFGIVHLDLCDASSHALNKIPLSYWHRFRKAVEGSPAILLLCTDSRQVKSSCANKLQTQAKAMQWRRSEPFSLFQGIEIDAISDKLSSIRPQSLLLATGMA